MSKSGNMAKVLMRAEQMKKSRAEMEKMQIRNRIGMDALARTCAARVQRALAEQQVQFDQQLLAAQNQLMALAEENKQLQAVHRELQRQQSAPQYSVFYLTPDMESSDSSNRPAVNPSAATATGNQKPMLEHTQLWEMMQQYEEEIDTSAIPKTPNPSREYFEELSRRDATIGKYRDADGAEAMDTLNIVGSWEETIDINAIPKTPTPSRGCPDGNHCDAKFRCDGPACGQSFNKEASLRKHMLFDCAHVTFPIKF